MARTDNNYNLRRALACDSRSSVSARVLLRCVRQELRMIIDCDRKFGLEIAGSHGVG